MKRTIVLADDFYEDPARVVCYAKTLEYICPYNSLEDCRGGKAVAWHASRWKPARECIFKSSEALIAKLEFLTGEAIDREHWNRDFPVDENGYLARNFEAVPRSAWWNCTFHAKHYKRSLLGEGVHSHTDRDAWNASGEDGWAGLIYFDTQASRRTGLHTWENIDPSRRFDWMTPRENWILCDTFANMYNRIILHRGDIPHSGSSGWGSTIHDGRFFQTFFFRTLSQPLVPGVTLGF